MSESEPSEETPSEASRAAGSWAAFLTMGMTTAALIAAGLLLGIWLDSVANTSPLLLFVGLILGVAAAVTTLVSQVRRSL